MKSYSPKALTPHRPDLWDRMNFIYRMPRLLSLYKRLWQDQRVPLIAKALPVLALLYIVFPLDAIADWIPGLGQLDDAAVLLLALKGFTYLSPYHVVDEHAQAVGLRSPHV